MPPVSSRRRFFFAPSTASASGEKAGAMMTSENSLPISSAVLPSSGRLAAMMPPKALTGSQASARS